MVRVLGQDLSWRRGSVLGAALVAGALLPLLAALAWAATWGSDPAGLWEPLFAFRAASLQVIFNEDATGPDRRAVFLALTALGSGLALLLGTFIVASVRRLRRGEPLAVALTLMVVVAASSIALGGSYWSHYLVELVPAAALSAAALSVRAQAVRRVASAAVVVASAVVVTAVQIPAEQIPDGQVPVGHRGCGSNTAAAAEVRTWLRARAQPGTPS